MPVPSGENCAVASPFPIPRRARAASGAAFVAVGDGEPVVLVHGVGLRLEAWAPQIAALCPHHRVIAVDLPGHGHSAPLPGEPSLPAFADWLACTLADIGCGPANLAGHSMGALVALGHALSRPQQVLRLAMLNGVCRRDPQARRAVLARAQAIAAGHKDVDGPLTRWFDGAGTESARRAREDARRWLDEVDPAGYASAYRAFALGDDVYAGRIGELRCPALFMTGEHDPNSTPAMSRDMARAAPRARAVVLAGQRHMAALVAPAAVNEELVRWLHEPAARPAHRSGS